MINKYFAAVFVSVVLASPSLCHSGTNKTLGRYDITFKLNNREYRDSILIDQYFGDNKYGGHVIGGTNVTAYKNFKLFCISTTDARALGESWCIELQDKKKLTTTYTGTVSGYCSDATPTYTGVTVPAIARKFKATKSGRLAGAPEAKMPGDGGIALDRRLLQKAADLQADAISMQ